MFPYRRGNKKRGKGGPGGGVGPGVAGGGPGGGGGGFGRRHGGGGGGTAQGPSGGRRVPGGPHELLSMLQPATKALAQVLAGHARPSGQVAHARGVLAQAERLVEERAVDRLNPAHREEFFEQVARLKLTLADAGEAEPAEEAEPEPRRVAPPLPLERLRALALSLAAPPSEPPPPRPAPFEFEPEDDLPPPPAAPPPGPRADIPQGSPRSARLRLKPEVRIIAKGREGRL